MKATNWNSQQIKLNLVAILFLVAMFMTSCTTSLHVSNIAQAQVIGALEIPLGNVAVIKGHFVDRRRADTKGMEDFASFQFCRSMVGI